MRTRVDRLLVAVLAFKAVYTLEVKRRSNDKKVIALYVEYVVCFLSDNLHLIDRP